MLDYFLPNNLHLKPILHPHINRMAEPCPILGRHLKHLIIQDEEVEAAAEVPDPDPRNLHTLIMSLSEESFEKVTQMLSLTPNLTPNEVRDFLLEEDRKQAAVTKGPGVPPEQSATQGQGDKFGGKHCSKCKNHSHGEDICWLLHPELSRKPRCGACGKVGHGEDRCWELNPALAPAWYQKPPLKQNNAEVKGKGRRKKVKVCCLSTMVEEG